MSAARTVQGEEATMEQAYAEGFKAGTEWSAKWADHAPPGGPYAWDDTSRALRAEWLRGWRDGRAT